MIEFTTKAECPKCGNLAFSWKWIEAKETPLHPQEHLRLTCLLCGFAFAMQTKDAVP